MIISYINILYRIFILYINKFAYMNFEENVIQLLTEIKDNLGYGYGNTNNAPNSNNSNNQNNNNNGGSQNGNKQYKYQPSLEDEQVLNAHEISKKNNFFNKKKRLNNQIAKLDKDIANIDSDIAKASSQQEKDRLRRQRNSLVRDRNNALETKQNLKAGLVNQIVNTLNSAVQIAGTIIQANIQKNVNNTQAIYDAANVTLEKNLEILTNSIKLGGTVLSSAFTTSSQLLTGSISQAASSAVDSYSSSMLEASKTQRQQILLELQKTNKLEIIEKQRQVKNLAETNKQINAGFEAAAIAAGLAVNVIPCVGQVASAIILGAAGLAKGIAAVSTAINQAKNEAELKRLEQEKAYLEKQQDAYNKLVDGLQEQAKQQLMAAKNLIEPMTKAAKEYDDIFRKSAIELGVNASKYVKEEIKRGQNLILDSAKNIYLDWSAEQRAKFQQAYSEKSGFAISLTDRDELLSGAMSKLWDENIVNDISSAMQLFNHSVSSSVDMMYEMYQTARQMGVSQAKFSKELAKNIKLAERHQFKGGIKGLMDMTLWAQKMRYNMEEFGSMLGKIKDGGLEGIIENSARLQVLGGNFAMGADPLAMWWEAYNDPQALGKRNADMVRGMGFFNEKIGDADFNAHDQMMLEAMAKATGQSVENLMNVARANIKRNQLEGLITNSKYSEAQKELIYSKAVRNEKGEWEVNGKNINKLEKTDFAELEDTNKGILAHVADINSMLQSERGLSNRNMSKFVSENFDEVQTNFKDLLNETKNFGDQSGRLGEVVKKYFGFQLDALEKQDTLTLENTDLMIKGIDIMRSLNDTETLNKGFNSMREGFKALLSKDPDALKMFADSNGIDVGNSRQTNLINNVLDEMYSDNFSLAHLKLTKDMSELIDKHKDENGYIDWTTLSKTSGFDDLMTRFFFEDEIRNNLHDKVGLSNNPNEWGGEVAKTVYKNLYKHYTDEGFNKEDNKINDVNDSFILSNNSPMLTAASSITPIQDGSVQLAKSDPKDSAIFAKKGGPFDTLFNGIFAKINEISEVLPKSMQYSMPIDIRRLTNEGLGSSKSTTNSNNIQINPVKIELNGKLELTSSNGQSVDIINELRNNPMILRQLTQMISESLNENIYGGKSTYDGGITSGRFNKL